MLARLLLGAALLAGALLAAPAWAGAREDILAADKAFSEMSVAKGAHAAFLAYMTDDARLFDGDHPPILGKTAAAAYYAREEKSDPTYAASRLEWTPVDAGVSPDGGLGWTRGTWTWSAKNADGTAAKVTGYYVTGWRRQADGRYKFELDIGGADKKPR
jgi:ketosteroid isomerase-like protein